MRNYEVWKIALPMISLGAVLMGLGGAAAWYVNNQQAMNSELISREVSGVIVVEELHMVMREIRYQVNIFLRTNNPSTLIKVADSHAEADKLLSSAKELARSGKETELIDQVARGYNNFFDEFQRIYTQLDLSNTTASLQVKEETSNQLTHLSDVVLTTEVLNPLREYIQFNKQVVQRTDEANRSNAQHLKFGFLLLGLCGGAAGALLGIAIAKGIGRSIVQLNVSVHGMMDRLSNLTGPVQFSHHGNLQSIELLMKQVEENIAKVVADLQIRERELLRSEQLAQVGKLATGLAHELRNPLMPMKMLVQASMQKGDDVGLSGRSLKIINDEIGRMERSIEVFLDFARPPKPEIRNHDLNAIIHNVSDLSSARLRIQQVNLELDLPIHPVIVKIDRNQITQLLLNLFLNALDAINSGGSLRIELREESDATQLSVIDDGSGIPSDMLDKIFDPFVTSKENGTGLGLSICKRIAQAHGGNLSVANLASGGSRFTLTLPNQATDISNLESDPSKAINI